MTDRSDLSKLIKLGDSLKSEEVKRLIELQNIPSKLCENVTEGTDLFYVLKHWENHNPYFFYKDLTVVRPDLAKQAKQFSWLVSEEPVKASEYTSQGESRQAVRNAVENDRSVQTFIRVLQNEITKKEWNKISLILPSIDNTTASEMKLKLLVDEGFISTDLTKLCELMVTIMRPDIAFTFRKNQGLVSGIANQEFIKLFKKHISSINLTEYWSTKDLGDELTPVEAQKLSDTLKFPPGICEHVTDGTSFLSILKQWGKCNPYQLYQAFDSIGRPDLTNIARKISWLKPPSYGTGNIEGEDLSVRLLLRVLKSEIRNEDWLHICLIIPGLKTSMSFEQKMKLFMRNNYFSNDLSRLISLMLAIERADIIPIIEQHQKLFRAIPDELFVSTLENEILAVKLSEYSSLLELGDQLKPEDIQKLAKLPIVPSALCDHVTDGTEFLSILKEWGKHDPYRFYQELNAIGRPDLSEKAKKYPWLATDHQTDFVSDSFPEEMSLKILIRDLKTNIQEKDWFRLSLIIPDLKAQMSFGAKMNILIHEGYISRDMTRLCELMSVINRHDIEFIIQNHQDVFFAIPDDIPFLKRFENEVAYLEKETTKSGQSLL